MSPTAAPASFDVQGLGDLRRKAAQDGPAALAEAAVQFEALFIGMMLKSAREASVGDGIFDNDTSMQYLELMDSQVALDLARRGGFGIGKMLLEQLGAPQGEGDAAPDATLASLEQALSARPGRSTSVDAALLAVRARVAAVSRVEKVAQPEQPAPATPEEFVARFLPEATTAAQKLG